MDVLWLGECPEPGCTLPCELIRTDRWDSTCGPVQTRRTRCLAGHVRDSHPVPVPIPRQMSCGECRCEAHLMPCECGCRCPIPGAPDEIIEELDQSDPSGRGNAQPGSNETPG